MTVSAHGVRRSSSPSQSNERSTTTHFGTASASSSSSRSRSASGPPVGTYGSVLAAAWSPTPSIAFAYGSISSFAGLKRWPRSGAQGPCTR